MVAHKAEQLSTLESVNLVVLEEAVPVRNRFADRTYAIEIGWYVGDLVVDESKLI